MHYGSGSGSSSGSNSGSGFGSGAGLDPYPTYIQHKMDKKSPKNRNDTITFWEILLFLKLKRQDFVPIFLLLKKLCKKYCLDPEPWPEPEPEPEPELEPKPKLFQSRNRKDNKSLRFHNTA
jgi:hypothetical protein